MGFQRSLASRAKATHVSQPDLVKDLRSQFLSVFNMMNLIVGGGVIGLPYAAANFGWAGFVMAISSVLCVAMTTQAQINSFL